MHDQRAGAGAAVATRVGADKGVDDWVECHSSAERGGATAGARADLGFVAAVGVSVVVLRAANVATARYARGAPRIIRYLTSRLTVNDHE